MSRIDLVDMLDVQRRVVDDDSKYDIEGIEYMSFFSYAGGLKYNDVIRIAADGRDMLLYPHESSIIVRGKVLKVADNKKGDAKFVQNGLAMLFSEIRIEMYGSSVDDVKNPGRSGIMWSHPLLSVGERRQYDAAMFNDDQWGDKAPQSWLIRDDGSFEGVLPLKLVLGMCADHSAVMLRAQLELILVRARSDCDAIWSDSADAGEEYVVLDQIVWDLPRVRVKQEKELMFATIIEKGKWLPLQFWKRELLEFPNLPQTPRNSIQVKTASSLERPFYIIIGFQIDNEFVFKKNSATFDFLSMQNIQVNVNNETIPRNKYDMKGNGFDCYRAYRDFRNWEIMYGGKLIPEGGVTLYNWMKYSPLFVFDISTVTSSLISDGMNIRVDYESANNIPEKTVMYVLMFNRRAWAYEPLRKIIQRQ